MFKSLLFVLITSLLVGCDFGPKGLDETFGRQHFVSAVAMIELYNVRNGEYPDTLNDLEFLGDWDKIWMNVVRYEKTESGYNLFVERGWMGRPSLFFPVEFKNGLGIEKTNVEWIESQENQIRKSAVDTPAEQAGVGLERIK